MHRVNDSCGSELAIVAASSLTTSAILSADPGALMLDERSTLVYGTLVDYSLFLSNDDTGLGILPTSSQDIGNLRWW